ncbi:hypothetical protein [Blastococcus sp. KM273128]|uniref:hypothetical protein n=1 Tax=Blastococcus sp. KM273128 TaxID=2570314 RepID=UPI001F1ACEB9|nr:hypothetical protein [Blastococcus sp. KM273128]
MGILSKLAKGGMAKKVMDEARKPQNQQKIKDAISSFTDKRKGGGTSGTNGTSGSTPR